MLSLSSVCGEATMLSNGVLAFTSSGVNFVLMGRVVLLPILNITSLIQI
jgi:hypothetical protein